VTIDGRSGDVNVALRTSMAGVSSARRCTRKAGDTAIAAMTTMTAMTPEVHPSPGTRGARPNDKMAARG